jgi:hypothetical protein
MGALAAGHLLDLLVEGLDVVASRKAVELLLVDRLDAQALEVRASVRAAGAEDRAVPLVAGEHQEQLRHASAEAQDIEASELLARNLETEDPQTAAPEVIGRGGAQRQRGDLPEIQTAIEGRRQDLPVTDHGLLPVPADGVGLVVGPDAQGIAVGVGLSVAVGDDDVAGLEARDVASHGEHLADGAVAREDLAPAELGDVHGVGEGGVIDVVLRRCDQDPQVDIPRAHLAQLDLVERDHLRDVEFLQVAADSLALLGDGFGGDGVGSGHDSSLVS